MSGSLDRPSAQNRETDMGGEAGQAYTELVRASREWSLLASCGALLGWDERTYMPRGGTAHRAEQIGLLTGMVHQRITAPRIGELLCDLEQSTLPEDNDGPQAANVREIRRTHDRAVKVPAHLVEEIARTTTVAQGVWQDARKANRFQDFQPWLEKILRLKREEAQAVGYEESPYDALLDEYEPGATVAGLVPVFAALRDALVPLIQAVRSAPRSPRREILEREYSLDEQRIFSQEAASAIGFDFNSGRLDVTTHPFCSGIGPGDCRLTTRYNLRHFNEAFFGTLHEAGHGIYEQGLEPNSYGTPLGSAASLGIHESQSRLWENFVGRSSPFWEHFYPRARKHFPQALRDISVEDFVFAINEVRLSLIRVEADEATYNLHILLRFELEQALLAGDLPVSDLPGAWDEKFRAFLGLVPPTDTLGCLQDVHWSSGGVGYFPTYSLGNMYAAQFMEKIRADLPELDDEFRAGNFVPLKTWLRDKIHRQGQRYRPDELCKRITGRPLSEKPLVRYLKDKFLPLYGVS